MNTWIAGVGIFGLVSRPRLTRALASIFAVGSVADFTQQLYCKVKDSNNEQAGA